MDWYLFFNRDLDALFYGIEFNLLFIKCVIFLIFFCINVDFIFLWSIFRAIMTTLTIKFSNLSRETLVIIIDLANRLDETPGEAAKRFLLGHVNSKNNQNAAGEAA